MTTAVFRHTGAALDYTAPAALAAGDVVVQGELVGVLRVDTGAGSLGALAVEGVFDFPKASGAGSALDIGTDAFWDAAAKRATSSAAAGANKRLGRVVKANTDADATVRVRLSQ